METCEVKAAPKSTSRDPRRSAASPRRGRSLAGAVSPLANAMVSLVDSLRDHPCTALIDWLPADDRPGLLLADVEDRKAWALASIIVLDAIAHPEVTDPFVALGRFTARPPTAERKNELTPEAKAALSVLSDSEHVRELFPYVLDTYGPTSRLDVIKNPIFEPQRAARKEAGSFYTPEDVADFMVEAVAGPEPAERTWLDPACGSGVFLCAVTRAVKRRGLRGAALIDFATTRLWGMDIAVQAVDFAAFSVLLQLPPQEDISPLAIWLKLRRNFVAIDALAISGRRSNDGRGALGTIFADRGGPISIVCNPPYTQTTLDDVRRPLELRRSASKAVTLYLRFLEMAWTFNGAAGDQSAFVVPLSFAANRSVEHVHFRTELARARGDWTMLFFDRQPHALFGEDVKTRNAILIRRHDSGLKIRTSRMLKWTSRQRAEIFTEGRAVLLRDPAIRRFVPKLGSASEADLYEKLHAFNLQSGLRPSLRAVQLKDIHKYQGSPSLFVGGTAYNFLNVFRTCPAESDQPYSASSVHELTFADEASAAAGFAILSSRIAHWLWHVECDGFHVPAWFLDELIILNASEASAQKVELAKLGSTIWRNVKSEPLVSLNGGRKTLAFRPTAVAKERAEVDALLLAFAEVDACHLRTMDEFEAASVSIDGSQRLAKANGTENSGRGDQ